MRIVSILHTAAATGIMLAIAFLAPAIVEQIPYIVAYKSSPLSELVHRIGDLFMSFIKDTPATVAANTLLIISVSVLAFLILRLLKPVYRESLASNGHSIGLRC